jgi:hypothetical protein
MQVLYRRFHWVQGILTRRLLQTSGFLSYTAAPFLDKHLPFRLPSYFASHPCSSEAIIERNSSSNDYDDEENNNNDDNEDGDINNNNDNDNNNNDNDNINNNNNNNNNSEKVIMMTVMISDCHIHNSPRVVALSYRIGTDIVH